MNKFLSLFLIIVVIVVVIIGVIITQGEHIGAMNEAIDEYTGNDPHLSPSTRSLLSPLKFERFREKPLEYAYSYQMGSSPSRRVILVTAPRSSHVILNGSLLTDVLEEGTSSTRDTYAGYIEAGEDVATLIVSSPSGNRPVINVAMESVGARM